MMRHLETNGIGSALRMLYRPVAMFSDAFDFLTGEDAHAAEPAPDETRRAIADMRSAAQRLHSVAAVVTTRSEPTARQVIENATDEAAQFDA